jgi:hypothetical protein
MNRALVVSLAIVSLVASSAHAAEDEVEEIFRPGGGRVPMQVTAERRQSIGLTMRDTVAVNGFSLMVSRRDICATPCTLYLVPGQYWVSSAAKGVTEALSEVDLPREGLRLRLRSGSTVVHSAGVAVLVVGVAAVVGGIVSLILPSVDVSSLDRTRGGLLNAEESQTAYTAGEVLGGVGLAAVVSGAVLVHRERGGVASEHPYGFSPKERKEESDPAAPSPSARPPSPSIDAWVVPQRTGAGGGVRIRF